MYKLLLEPLTGRQNMVLRLSDNANIPMSENNRDYQEYLEWVAAGNTPEPADE
jgi:hypothetical protein